MRNSKAMFLAGLLTSVALLTGCNDDDSSATANVSELDVPTPMQAQGLSGTAPELGKPEVSALPARLKPPMQ